MITKYEKYSQNLFLIRQLARRDRYRENASMFLGQFWQILNPFIHTLVLVLIFTKVFEHDNFINYPLYIASGTTFFEFFSYATTICMNALTSNKQFLLKTQIEKSIFAKEKLYVSIVNLMYSLVIYFGMVVVYGLPFRFTFFLLIPDIIIFSIFIYGIGLVLAVINVYFADIEYLYDIITLFLFYGTAIFYSVDRMAPILQMIMSFNPIYIAIAICRLSVIDGIIPSVFMWIKLLVWAIASLLIGRYVFKIGTKNIIINL